MKLSTFTGITCQLSPEFAARKNFVVKKINNLVYEVRYDYFTAEDFKKWSNKLQNRSMYDQRPISELEYKRIIYRINFNTKGEYDFDVVNGIVSDCN